MIDTHSHLLPGLDDGASDMSETLRLAHSAVQDGIDEVVCTPHARDHGDPGLAMGRDVLSEVEGALSAAGIPLRLHLGYELSFSFAASLDESELEGLTLGSQSRAILVEMPYTGWPLGAADAVFRWRLRGLLPVLAHPERNDRVQRDPAALEELLRLGAVAQGTLPSLVGTFGSTARRTFLRLLADGWLSMVASDAHYGRGRPAGVTQGLDALRSWAPSADIHGLTVDNPARLLRGELLRQLGPVRVRRGWEKYFRRTDNPALTRPRSAERG